MIIIVKPIIHALHGGFITSIDEELYNTILSSLKKTFKSSLSSLSPIKVLCTIDEEMVGTKIIRRDAVIKKYVDKNKFIIIHQSSDIRKGIMPCQHEYMSSYIIAEQHTFTINPFVTVITEKQSHDNDIVVYNVFGQVSKESHIDQATDCLARLTHV